MAEDNEEQHEKIESEYEKKLKKIIYSIEVAIGEQLSKGLTPTVLIGNARTIDELIDFYAPGFQRSEIAPVDIAFGDGQVTLQVYRTMDMPFGKMAVI